MAKDKVISPQNKSRSSGIKSSKSSIIEGPTPSLSNLTPYNRKSK